MPAYKIERSDRPLQKLIIDVTSYADGCIIMEFAPEADLNTDQIAAELRLCKIQSEIQISPHALFIVDYANFKSIFTYVLAKGWLIEQDRPQMGQITQRCEQQLERRNTLVYNAQPGHKQALACLTDIYIEDILDAAADPQFATTLFCCTFAKNFPAIKSDLQILILNNRCRNDLIDSVEALWRINIGEANLEGHFSRISEKLPSLEIQRITTNNNITDQFLLKFASLSDEVKLICLLSMAIFNSPKQLLSPLADLKKIIKDALSESTMSAVTLTAFANFYGDEIMMTMVTTAFSHIGILRMQGGPDYQRLSALQTILKSPHIESYIREITLMDQQRSQEDSDPLYTALQARNVVVVASAIKRGSVINQYFTCGRTPLLLAIHNNDYLSVQLLVGAGSDVNQSNQYGIYNAIGAAVNCENTDILRFVLSQANARFYQACGVITLKSRTYPPVDEARPAPAFLIGAHQFLEDPNNPATRAMMHCLLEAGLGLGYEFQPEFTPLLDGMVVIGATWHRQANIHPITTIAEFQQRVSPGKFEYWKLIFQQAILNAHMFSSGDVVGQLSTLNRWMSEQRVTMALDSPVFGLGLRFQQALKRIEAVVQASGNPELNLIREALQQHAYGKALRQACSTENPNGFILAKIILELKEVFPLDINEKGKNKPLAAIHHAAMRGDQSLYDLLCAHQANPDLTNADGKSAKALLRQAMARSAIARV